MLGSPSTWCYVDSIYVDRPPPRFTTRLTYFSQLMSPLCNGHHAGSTFIQYDLVILIILFSTRSFWLYLWLCDDTRKYYRRLRMEFTCLGVGALAIWLWSCAVAKGIMSTTLLVLDIWLTPISIHTIHAALVRRTGPSFGSLVLASLILSLFRLLTTFLLNFTCAK